MSWDFSSFIQCPSERRRVGLFFPPSLHTDEQTSDKEVGVFKRTLIFDSDISSLESDHDKAVLIEQDTDSYWDTDSLASLAAPAEEDGLDVSVYAS